MVQETVNLFWIVSRLYQLKRLHNASSQDQARKDNQVALKQLDHLHDFHDVNMPVLQLEEISEKHSNCFSIWGMLCVRPSILSVN